MRKQHIVKTLIIGFMAMVLMIPSLAGADEQIKNTKQQQPVLETSKITIGSEAINQEVIQILRKGEMARVTLNIIGQPGVYFKVQYSATGTEGSYALLPKGSGIIGNKGFGSVSFNLKKLGKEEVSLTVTTSDTEDFAKPRVTPKPLVLTVEQVKIKARGERWIDQLKRIEREGGNTSDGQNFAPPSR